jgi:hypothetical protein
MPLWGLNNFFKSPHPGEEGLTLDHQVGPLSAKGCQRDQQDSPGIKILPYEQEITAFTLLPKYEKTDYFKVRNNKDIRSDR